MAIGARSGGHKQCGTGGGQAPVHTGGAYRVFSLYLDTVSDGVTVQLD